MYVYVRVLRLYWILSLSRSLPLSLSPSLPLSLSPHEAILTPGIVISFPLPHAKLIPQYDVVFSRGCFLLPTSETHKKTKCKGAPSLLPRLGKGRGSSKSSIPMYRCADSDPTLCLMHPISRRMRGERRLPASAVRSTSGSTPVALSHRLLQALGSSISYSYFHRLKIPDFSPGVVPS